MGGLDKHLSEWCVFPSSVEYFLKLTIWTSKKASFRQLATSPAYISLQTFAGCQSSFAQRRWETWETQLGHTVIQDFNPGLKIQDVGSWIQSVCKRSGFKIPLSTRNVDFSKVQWIYIYIYMHTYMAPPQKQQKKVKTTAPKYAKINIVNISRKCKQVFFSWGGTTCIYSYLVIITSCWFIRVGEIWWHAPPETEAIQQRAEGERSLDTGTLSCHLSKKSIKKTLSDLFCFPLQTI